MSVVSGLPIPIFAVIMCLAVVYGVLKLINVMKNKDVTANNEKIMANNQWLSNQEQGVLQEIEQIQNVYNERIAPWYPEKYSYLDAAQFFYDAVNNYRADNMKELINIYETAMHQQRMEEGQKEAIKQQKIGNFIGIITYAIAIMMMVSATKARMGDVYGLQTHTGEAFFGALCIIVAATIGIATRNSKNKIGAIVAAVAYFIGAFCAMAADIALAGILGFAFCVVFAISAKKTIGE